MAETSGNLSEKCVTDSSIVAQHTGNLFNILY